MRPIFHIWFFHIWKIGTWWNHLPVYHVWKIGTWWRRGGHDRLSRSWCVVFVPHLGRGGAHRLAPVDATPLVIQALAGQVAVGLQFLEGGEDGSLAIGGAANQVARPNLPAWGLAEQVAGDALCFPR